VLVPAYREAGGIAAKIDDVRANGYPGPLDVLVVADGDPETAARAEEAGATVLCAPERLGKSQALNLGFSKVATPIVVLSDANNRLAPGAIAALVAWFEDPRVGAAAGEKVEEDEGGEDLYWRFESWLKQREWRLGTTIGLVGELAAVRTDAWRPIPPDIAVDDLWTALDLSARGFAIAYEPRARAIEPPDATLAQQWERRTRSVAGALHIFRRCRRQLGPGGGTAAAQIWGHRLARYTVSPFAHVVLLGLALRRLPTSWLARAFVSGHVVGAWALWRRASDDTARTSLPATALGHALFLQGVALGGVVRYLRGDRPTKWPTVAR
jgi:cellulose synthase/poly-beta-1,6-N-acetylglucosamine synthase-like glycosyltransferase